jgi:hypothetical protein
MPEDPDDRGPQHTGEVPPKPNEPAWKKRKPGESKGGEQHKDNNRRPAKVDKKSEKDNP